MQAMTQRISKILKSRLALNIYFWIGFWLLEFDLNFHGRHAQYYYPKGWYTLFRIITSLSFAIVIYANNLWLIPKYFTKKRYGVYIILTFLITYMVGLGQAALMEMLDVRFPKIQMEDVYLFMAMRIGVSKPWILFAEALSWMVTSLITLIMFTVAWYMQDYQKQKRKTEEAERKQIETELKFLKSQINPHFLFNTLNNLYTLTIIKSDTAPEVVSKLSTILRYLLYESNTKEVTFEKEKEIMQAYIDLELLRLTKKDNLHFSISADKNYKLPPLLWIPILENVFKHGTRFISKEHFIDYRFDINEGQLRIYSRNGFKQDTDNKLEQSGGIGLTNLQKRLALLYPERHSIKTEVTDDQYITQINIDLYEDINS